ncbi:hypothetical protein [Paludisphaera borealis]|uniref:Uncharacterized protein n=1 Tax=Paludisphaera borealis TaxID=1387353 RepID=A0A1U7CM93_9BACT|nr:hypothetical protein [Paludisphaera borealis]APW60028.1 hypothetical protein BSF38_01490 [Paludisphaera borealis]MDR3619821.1 hypothetical protein [Paludisphaera borealis]
MRATHRRRRIGFGWVWFGVAIALVGRGEVGAQQASDAALRDRVLQLVERLDGDKPEARDAAEAALVKLGPKILSLLPETAGATNKERKDRLDRIRATLAAAKPDDNDAKPSRVTLQAKGIRLSDALQQLQKQTGNPISDLREQQGAEATNPSFDLDLKDVTFYEALDEVARRADVTISAFTGDGSVGITTGKPPEKALIQYVGAFRVGLREFSERRDYQTGMATANAAFEVAWEPRLRPMLLALKADQLVVKDDQGRVVKAQVMTEATDVVLRPENPVAEINVNLDAPERSAVKLAQFTVKADLTLPAGVKIFRFPSLAQEDVVIKQDDVAVTLLKTEIDEQVWKVGVVLSYPGEGPAFESYRQGLFNNRLWLETADGSRFEHNGGFSNTGNDGGKLGFEYLFVDVPGKPADYKFVYETPSRVITTPLEFTFKDVPLP